MKTIILLAMVVLNLCADGLPFKIDIADRNYERYLDHPNNENVSLIAIGSGKLAYEACVKAKAPKELIDYSKNQSTRVLALQLLSGFH